MKDREFGNVVCVVYAVSMRDIRLIYRRVVMCEKRVRSEVFVLLDDLPVEGMLAIPRLLRIEATRVLATLELNMDNSFSRKQLKEAEQMGDGSNGVVA